jgi:hypothetical protein
MNQVLIAIIVTALAASPAFAKGSRGRSRSRTPKPKANGPVYVKPHVKKDGTYVPPSHRKAPNASKFDNYSTKGNVNPYTGKEGTVDPLKP